MLFLCLILEFVFGFVLQASKTVVLFLCSLLQSSLQILGQTDGLLEIFVLRLAKQLCFSCAPFCNLVCRFLGKLMAWNSQLFLIVIEFFKFSNMENVRIQISFLYFLKTVNKENLKIQKK